MPWLQIKARITDAEAPQMEQLFQSAGAVSVTLLDAEDEPVFQLDPGSTPLWQHTLLCALFEEGTDTDAIIASIIAGSRLLESDLLTEKITDQDWERAWMADFNPMRFGKRLWVCPSWSEPPEPNAVNIMLDPGLAFGSGTHPTTALCLAWLDSQQLNNKRVIDYGCGSGILAIAAALLGASRVEAVDNDPQAVTASGNNRDMNGISRELMTVHLPGEAHEPADVVVANILSGPLAELTPVLTSLTKPGGTLILSGVLCEQTQTLMASYTPFFAMQAPIVRDEWVMIEGTRLSTGN